MNLRTSPASVGEVARSAGEGSTSPAKTGEVARSAGEGSSVIDRIHVVAGALYDERGRVLITQRPPGKLLAGRWEFPGGKLHDGEDAYDGLVRELHEELGVAVRAAEPLMRYDVDHPGRTVTLDMWIVTRWTGSVSGLDGQALKWVAPALLGAEDILEADQPIVAALSQRVTPDRR